MIPFDKSDSPIKRYRGKYGRRYPSSSSSRSNSSSGNSNSRRRIRLNPNAQRVILETAYVGQLQNQVAYFNSFLSRSGFRLSLHMHVEEKEEERLLQEELNKTGSVV